MPDIFLEHELEQHILQHTFFIGKDTSATYSVLFWKEKPPRKLFETIFNEKHARVNYLSPFLRKNSPSQIICDHFWRKTSSRKLFETIFDEKHARVNYLSTFLRKDSPSQIICDHFWRKTCSRKLFEPVFDGKHPLANCLRLRPAAKRRLLPIAELLGREHISQPNKRPMNPSTFILLYCCLKRAKELTLHTKFKPLRVCQQHS